MKIPWNVGEIFVKSHEMLVKSLWNISWNLFFFTRNVFSFWYRQLLLQDKIIKGVSVLFEDSFGKNLISVYTCVFILVQMMSILKLNSTENLSSLWGLIERGSPLSSLLELKALPGRACLPCLTPESDKVLVNLANSCRGAGLCLMWVWEYLVQSR